ncbi:OmpA family protein [Anaplasma bovis]|uniref:OmpA family protein n=1 Tax=Anaplasma bovis TaxID=186733 RepID=UPI002FF07EED
MLVRRLLCLLALFATAGCFTFFPTEKLRLDRVHFGAERVEKVFFDSEKYDLKVSGKRLILELVEQMKYNKDMYLTVVGHTDAVGTDEYNLALGEKRANAVKEFIVSCDKSLATRVVTYTKGKSEPEVLVYSSDSTDAEDAHSHNRRAVITVKFVSKGEAGMGDMSHLVLQATQQPAA